MRRGASAGKGCGAPILLHPAPAVCRMHTAAATAWPVPVHAAGGGRPARGASTLGPDPADLWTNRSIDSHTHHRNNRPTQCNGQTTTHRRAVLPGRGGGLQGGGGRVPGHLRRRGFAHRQVAGARARGRCARTCVCIDRRDGGQADGRTSAVRRRPGSRTTRTDLPAANRPTD